MGLRLTQGRSPHLGRIHAMETSSSSSSSGTDCNRLCPDVNACALVPLPDEPAAFKRNRRTFKRIGMRVSLPSSYATLHLSLCFRKPERRTARCGVVVAFTCYCCYYPTFCRWLASVRMRLLLIIYEMRWNKNRVNDSVTVRPFLTRFSYALHALCPIASVETAGYGIIIRIIIIMCHGRYYMR